LLVIYNYGEGGIKMPREEVLQYAEAMEAEASGERRREG